MRPIAYAAVLALLALAGGCAPQRAAPVDDRRPVATAQPRLPVLQPTPVPGAAPSGAYIVKRGDTLYSIALEHGDYVPEPDNEADFSGRVLLRMPAGLHAALSRHAEQEGSSLNQLLVALLAGAIGWGAKRKPRSGKARLKTARRKSGRARVAT